MLVIRIIYKSLRKLYSLIALSIGGLYTHILFRIHRVDYGPGLDTKGIPQIHVDKDASCRIGAGLRLNNGLKYNRIGRQGPCQIIVGKGARLQIGNNLGMSSSAIICHHDISIGDRVLIGGNVVIYDTDFHSLDADARSSSERDEAERQYGAVLIADDVFIGAHTTILKGVSIGAGAIIGACSVVTRNVPAGEIWAGNPAKFIRKGTQTSSIQAA